MQDPGVRRELRQISPAHAAIRCLRERHPHRGLEARGLGAGSTLSSSSRSKGISSCFHLVRHAAGRHDRSQAQPRGLDRAVQRGASDPAPAPGQDVHGDVAEGRVVEGHGVRSAPRGPRARAQARGQGSGRRDGRDQIERRPWLFSVVDEPDPPPARPPAALLVGRSRCSHGHAGTIRRPRRSEAGSAPRAGARRTRPGPPAGPGPRRAAAGRARSRGRHIEEGAEAGAPRRPGPGAGQLPGDAEGLLHKGLGAVRRRTLLLSCGRSRRRSRRPSAWPSSPTSGVNLSPELHARLQGLNNYLDTDNSAPRKGPSPAPCRPSTGPSRPRRAGRGQVLRRQRLDRAGARAAVRAHPRAGAARERRRDHGLRDRRLAGKPEPRLSRRHPVLQPGRKQRTQHRHDRPGGGARAPALPHHREHRIPALRRKGLRLGADLPARRRRAVRGPHQPPRRSSNRRSGATTRGP